eukprot:scaffold23090_cov65-Phaeocystis_antarctica.AAC.10
MGGTSPSSLRTAPDSMVGTLPFSSLSAGADAAVRSAAACPSGDRATHSAASSMMAKLPSLPCSWPRAASAPPPAPAAASSLVSGGAAAALSAATTCPSGDRATHSAASSMMAKLPRLTCLPPRCTPGPEEAHAEVGRLAVGHEQRHSPSACACCRASSLVSGGADGGAATAFCAAACPSGDRATHSAASSAVAKRPRLTCLPPRLTDAM